MQAVLTCDARAGTWVTVPLHVLHRHSLGFASQERVRSDSLNYPAPDSSYCTSNQIKSTYTASRWMSDTVADAKAAAAAVFADWDWQEVEQMEEVLMVQFVRQACTLLAVQGSLSIVLMPLAQKHLASRSVTTVGLALAGTMVVAMGCLFIERADCGLRMLDVDEADDDPDEVSEGGNKDMDEFGRNLNQWFIENQVVLACHSRVWRWTGLSSLVAGFTCAVVPLMATETSDLGKQKLLSVLSLVGSGACVAGLCSLQLLGFWGAGTRRRDSRRSSLRGTSPVPRRLALMDAGQEEAGTLARLNSSLSSDSEYSAADPVPPPTNAQRVLQWLRTAQGAVPLRGTWIAASVAGACTMACHAGARYGCALSWSSVLVATLKPASMLILHSGILRNNYRMCCLRVSCPRLPKPAENGASKKLFMWQSAAEVLDYRALEVQLSCLQIKAFLLTCFMTLIPPQYSIPFVLTKVASDGIVRNVLL